MAGRRSKHGRPTRRARRAAFWAGRLAEATDAEAQFDTAADYLRAMASRHPDPAGLLNRAARFLVALADGRQTL